MFDTAADGGVVAHVKGAAAVAQRPGGVEIRVVGADSEIARYGGGNTAADVGGLYGYRFAGADCAR